MRAVGDALDRVAEETSFSGVVRVEQGGEVLARAYGLARRDVSIDMTVDHQIGIASGTKGWTALVVASLVEGGELELGTTARALLGADLPLIADDVTVEHLLAHRSGIGDYVDEDEVHDVTDHLLPVPVHQLETTEAYLRVLDGHATKFPAGERFSYCNSGFVVLALLCERATGVGFPELVDGRVCRPAGMTGTAFPRSDELPGRAAVGYLAADGDRTNVFHLPVVGSGDGGIHTTAADVHALWHALFAGRIVSTAWVERLLSPHSDVPAERARYGLGFWLHAEGDGVSLVGGDAGASFRTVHHRGEQLTHTVLSNTSQGAWPVTRLLDELLLG